MASTEPIRIPVNTPMTVSEAIKWERLVDRYNPTPFSKQGRWVNSKTGKPISIGYTSR